MMCVPYTAPFITHGENASRHRVSNRSLGKIFLWAKEDLYTVISAESLVHTSCVENTSPIKYVKVEHNAEISDSNGYNMH